MGSDLVTVVANYVYHHDQSIDLGIRVCVCGVRMCMCMPYDLTEMRRRSVMLVIHLSSSL